MIKNLPLALLVLFATTIAKAQNLQDDFELITRQLETAVSCHLVSSVTLYDSKSNKKSLLSFKAELKKSGDSYRSRMDDMEVISNKDLMVLVDHSEKIVQVQENPKMNRSDREFLEDFYSADSLARTAASVELVSDEGGIKTYRAKSLKGMITEMLVTINTTDHVLKRIEYEYNADWSTSGSYVVIEYSVFNLQASFDKSVFDASDVIIRRANGFALKEKYHGFELLDLREME